MRKLSNFAYSSEPLGFSTTSSSLSTDFGTSEYFKNTREPFLVTSAGRKLAILTSPQDVAATYLNTRSLSMDAYVKDIQLRLGLSPDVLHKIYQSPKEFVWSEDGKEKNTLFHSDNPLQKNIVYLIKDLFKQQVHPGERLNFLGSQFMHQIDRHLHWESLEGSYILSSSDSRGSTIKTVSLYKWCREVLVDTTTKAFFGKKLLEIDPMFHKSLYDWDERSWKLLYRYPRILSKDMHSAKAKILDTLSAYLRLPKEDRSDASWIIQTLVAEYSQLAFDECDIAVLLFGLIWA